MVLDRKRKSLGLTPGELRRWMKLKRILNQEFAPNSDYESLERRESVRVPARVRVAFEKVGELCESLMTCLSRGGLFVATDAPLEIGAKFELRIDLEETGDSLVAPVEVVSHNARPDRPVFEPGMGVRFLAVDADTRAKLDALYESKLEEAGRKKASAEATPERRSA